VDRHGRRPAADPTALQIVFPLRDMQALLAELTGSDEAAAEAAALMLAQAGDAALPTLATLFDSPDANHRWWAVRTLAAMPEPRMDWLRRSLDDPNPEVRAAGALAFIAHPDPAAVQALIALVGDEDSVASAVAVSALVALGSNVVPSLLEAYSGSSLRGRVQILRALREIRDPRAIHVMMKALGEGSAAMQYWAREGLEALGLDMVYMKPE
jgi:HEAT repeat protein